MTDRTVNWTVTVSEETDAAMRQHLVTHGLTDRDLPDYVENAVRWRLYDQRQSTTLALSAKLRTGPPPEYFTQLRQQLLTGAVSRLLEVLHPTAEPVECPTDQQLALAETEIGTKLPTDYKQFIKHYGSGSVCDFLGVYNPVTIRPWNNLILQSKGNSNDPYIMLQGSSPEDYPYPRYPAPGGLLPWGHNINGDVFYWWTIKEPDLWPIVMCPRHDDRFSTFGPNMASFIWDLVVTGRGKNLFPGENLRKGDWNVPKR